MINSIKKSNTIVIKIKSFSYNIIKFYMAAFFLIIKNKQMNFKIQPVKLKKLTILRSPHKYKKAQEHYQLKIYSTILIVKDVNISELLVLLTNKPQGIFLNIKIKQTIN